MEKTLYYETCVEWCYAKLAHVRDALIQQRHDTTMFRLLVNADSGDQTRSGRNI